jgi:hypothetical protein
LSAGSIGAGLIITRLIVGLFFHGALTSIAGYFYARAHVRKLGLAQPVAVLVLVVLAHSVYNYFAYGLQNDISYIFGTALHAAVESALRRLPEAVAR